MTGDRLLNQPAKKLALLGERMRATPHQCFMAEPIAVIGVGCRFPEAHGPDAFWRLLAEGRNAITEVPRDRWDVDAYFDADPQTPGKTYSRWGGFVDHVDAFDAEFFGIAPREAKHMDPRQRLLLETAWEALEHAAYAPSHLAGSNTGVFIGHMVGDYYALETRNAPGIDSYCSTGNLDSILANRLSYVLNLQGPSMAVDTACSSSLVALYLACQSLRQDECQLALAGGVNLILTPEMHVMGAKSLLLSPEGQCKTFDRRADGFVRGEGCGLLVLKRLADAFAAGDNVLAVIRGVAINQDGRTNGISAPNGLSQQRVIRRALDNALLDASGVTFVETHGTGTVVGDTIEVEALAAVYGGPEGGAPCYLGAVKTNLGHLEGAAGAAGMIKMVLCLHHGRIPPNLNFTDLNPHIALAPTRFQLPHVERPWPACEGPRRGAVSSFGLGGTNGHVIMEETPAFSAAPAGAERPLHILTLSAKTPRALRDLAGRYEDYFAATPELSVPDVAFTANTGREHFSHRAAVITEGRAPLCIDQLLPDTANPPITAPRVAFLFPGDAQPGVDAGRTLYETQPAFCRAIERCHNERCGAHDALFSFQYALAEMWRSWGIQPSGSIGTGAGACVAQCVAGTLRLEDALDACASAPVLSRDAIVSRITDLHAQGCNVFLELGPKPQLCAWGREAVQDPDVVWLSSFDPAHTEWRQLLACLAALYLRGVDVDWAGFDYGYPRRKVHLPSYPFQRQRHWLQVRDALPQVFYRLEWQRLPLPTETSVEPAGEWLVIARDKRTGSAIAEHLQRRGARAEAAAVFPETPLPQYRGVIFVCAAASGDVPTQAEVESVALLDVVQAMVRCSVGARLWIVTQDSQAITGSEAIAAGQAPLWGLARTLRLEHPEFNCTSVDLLSDEDPDVMIPELLSPSALQVAYRAGDRYVARLTCADDAVDADAPTIDSRGSYLITGGLGALGMAIARYLVDQGARHLVLAGRRAGDRTQLAALASHGATVQAMQADVSRAEDVARLIAACQAQGPLRGIIHAAGVLDDGILAKQSAERFARVMAPKVRGAWELHLQTLSMPLDFFVCFSSIASLLGSSGQGNYAAANAFLDALAHHRRALGLRGLSINWGPWSDAGMSAGLASRMHAHGEEMISPALGTEIFARALAMGVAQLGAMRVDWPRYAEAYSTPEFLRQVAGRVSAAGQVTAGPTFLEHLQSAPSERRRDLLEEYVLAQVALVLGHAERAVPRTQGFAHLGMDSLSAIELRARLERALGCGFPATLAFDYPNVDLLSDHLFLRLFGGTSDDVSATPSPATTENEELEDLTRDELAALLARELRTFEEGP